MLSELFNSPCVYIPVGDNVANDEFYDKIPRELTFMQLLEFIDKNGYVVALDEDGIVYCTTGITVNALQVISKYDRIYVIRKLSAKSTHVCDAPIFIPEDLSIRVLDKCTPLFNSSDFGAIMYGYFRIKKD